jgi:hypothetical protein
MSSVILDGDLKSKLNGLNQIVDVRSPSGQRVGRFVPEEEFQKLFYAALAKECPYSADELARMHTEEGGETLADYLRRIGA